MKRVAAASAVAFALVLTGGTPALADDGGTADVTPPVIVSTGLTDGQLVPAVGFFTPTITDDVGVTKVIATIDDSAGFATCGFDASHVMRCKGVFSVSGDGTDVTVKLVAYDQAGNASVPATTRVHVDSVAPKGTISPAAGSGMRSGPVDVTLSGVSDDVVRIDMTTDTTETLTAAPWAFTWNATETATPPCFKIWDRAGNSTGICSNYVVADEPPVISSVINESEYATYLLDDGTGWVGTYGTFLPAITGRAPVDHFEWWVNGVRRSAATGTWTAYYWHDGTAGMKSAQVELRVWDTAGNEATKSFKVNVTLAAPTMATSPGHILVRGKTVTITAKASDPHGIKYQGLEGADGAYVKSAIATQVTLPTGPDGVRSWTWLAIDDLGNQGEAKRWVTVDNTSPTLTVSAWPANNSKLTRTVAITAKSTDHNGVARVVLLVNGKVVATDSTAGYAFSLNPAKYGKKFTVQVRSYDKAGNIHTSPARTYRH